MNLSIKVLYSALFFAIMISTLCEAHIFQGVELNYDFEGQTLLVEIKHVARDPREDYVRKLVVFKNGEEVLTKYYKVQINPSQFTEELSVEAEDGDQISVKAYAVEGGSRKQSIVVKEDKKEDSSTKK